MPSQRLNQSSVMPACSTAPILFTRKVSTTVQAHFYGRSRVVRRVVLRVGSISGYLTLLYPLQNSIGVALGSSRQRLNPETLRVIDCGFFLQFQLFGYLAQQTPIR